MSSEIVVTALTKICKDLHMTDVTKTNNSNIDGCNNSWNTSLLNNTKCIDFLIIHTLIKKKNNNIKHQTWYVVVGFSPPRNAKKLLHSILSSTSLLYIARMQPIYISSIPLCLRLISDTITIMKIMNNIILNIIITIQI